MRLNGKQKTVYFALDKTLVRRHHTVRFLIAFLNAFAFMVVVAVSLLTSGNKSVFAAAYTWDGGGSTNNWSECANWSTNVCPTAADTVTFNTTSLKNSTVDASFGGTVSGVTIASGYTGTITLDRSLTSSGVFTQASGSIFTAGSNDLFVASTFTISSGATFNAGSGRVVLNGATTATITCNNTVFNRVAFEHTSNTKTVSSGCNLPLGTSPTFSAAITMNGGQLSGTGTITTSASLTLNNGSAPLSGFTGLIVNGILTVSGGATTDFSTYTTLDANSSFVVSGSSNFIAPTGEMSVAGALTVTTNGSYNPNGGTINFDGATALLSCGIATFSHVILSHTSGTKTINNGCNFPLGTNPSISSGVALSGTLSGSGTLNHTAGTLTLASGGSVNGFSELHANILIMSGTYNFSSLNNITTTQGMTISTTGTVTAPAAGTVVVGGAFTMNGSPASFVAPGDTLSVAGAFTINAGSTFTHNNGTVVFNGSTGNITCAGVTFHLVRFEHSGGTKTVFNDCALPVGANPDLGVGSVTLRGNLSGSGTLTAGGRFTVGSGYSLTGFTQFVGNTFTANTPTADFSGFTQFSLSGNEGITFSSGNFIAPAVMNVIDIDPAGGTFTHNNGTVNFNGDATKTVNCGNFTFFKVTIAVTGGIRTFKDDCTLPLGSNPTVGSAGTVIFDNIVVNGSGTLTTANAVTISNATQLNGFTGLVANNTLTLSGASLNFSNYTLVDFNNTFSVTNGSSFVAPSAIMSLASSIVVSANSSFAHGNGTVVLDGTNSLVSGDITFFNLTKTYSGIATITFTAGSTTTVQNNLTLRGTTASLLGLMSSTPGSQWNIDALGLRNLRYLSVQDSNNINADVMQAYDSEDMGNNINWEFPTTLVEPTAAVTNFGFAQASLAVASAAAQQQVQAPFANLPGIRGMISRLAGVLEKIPGGRAAMTALIHTAAGGAAILAGGAATIWIPLRLKDKRDHHEP